MTSYDKFYEIADKSQKFLRRDLIGPVKDDEIIENITPLDTYVMGILWPGQTLLDIEKKEDSIIKNISYDEDSDEFLDDTITSANQFKPSTLGISFMVGPDEKKIDFSFSFAKYLHSSRQEDGRQISLYSRQPYIISSHFNIPANISSVSCEDDSIFISENIQAKLFLRKIQPNGAKLITISISNMEKAKNKNIEKNEAAIFQCELKIHSHHTLMPIYKNCNLKDDDEEKVNNLLYKNILNYAYGHGCSVKYSKSKDGKVYDISSDFMPSQMVTQMMPGKIKTDEVLYLKFWSESKTKEDLKLLESFIEEYRCWLKKKITENAELVNYKDAENIIINNIEQCIERLENSLQVLYSNELAWNSFKLMNEAMLLQRKQSKGANPETVKWYPFQLAYILQIIPDIVNPNNKYRNSVDLLWFPTGGGKTEAYLGVAAFTIFYRRLRDRPILDGVTVFMRYTLRLLTIQQFERASVLICCCELLRRKYNIPGGEISIGLWIGSGMTPNHINDAKTTLDKLRTDPDYKVRGGNPMQILECPYCKKKLDLSSYKIGSKMKISCSNNDSCPFHDGLPIYVIDDDIYDVKPTLILSTVDKFARITWEEKSKNLFCYEDKHPELIIQDELHLISGPLGSLAGIYEITVDALCNDDKGISPKVIASTATIKRASKQIKNLYNRETIQFPPNGFSCDDSFFAINASKDEKPARTYIGLCENGGSLTDLIIRVYANLLFQKQMLLKQNVSEEIVDHFYTTVGYFNAIKDLGASASIINDRVNSYIGTLCLNKFKDESEALGISKHDISKYIRYDELTSRKTSREIKNILDNLDKAYTDPLCYSYIFASNMLSVGIDINRLGVMTVYGQPKSNSEYIQATSRVGRQNPGMVFVMYNSNRSRDKSHYEQFPFYHQAFYQYVEATSVTPFSERTIEKALHCVFIAMVRHLIPYMDDNDSAGRFSSQLEGVNCIKERILKRVSDISLTSYDYAENILNQTIDAWEILAQEYPDTLTYNNYSAGKQRLLVSNNDEMDFDFPVTINTLRNVENESNVYISQR